MNINFKNYIDTLSDNKNVKKILEIILDKIDLNIDIYDNNKTKIIHICDWVTSIVENNEIWKTPRVLTIDALNNAADKYFQKKNNKIQIIELDEEHEKLIADLGDYYVVQMLTPEALDNESKVMQHCIGHGSYDRKVKNPDYQYLSLRDKFNKAHATLEIIDNEVVQIQGKQNKVPDKKYLNILITWLMNLEYVISLSKYNYAFNENDNKIYSIYELPENCIIRDKTIYFDSEKTVFLPNNLTVNGDINLFECKKIKKLPSGLVVNGSLDISNTDIQEIPNDIKVTKDLYLKNTKIKFLPDNLVIDGDLDLLNSEIEELPNNLTVNGKLCLRNTKIKKIPDNLIVNGILDLNHCKNIRELPNNLTVNGNLYLSNSQIQKLPDNLIVNGDLYAENIFLDEINENVHIKYGLYLSCSHIEKISDNLIINGNVDLSYCKNLKQLPNNFTVNGYLSLVATNIKEIPEDTKIQKGLYLSESKIEKLSDNLFVFGNLDLENCSYIKQLPKKLIVEENLNLSKTNIRELPDDIIVNNELNLEYSKIKKLPDDFSCNLFSITLNQISLIKETMSFKEIRIINGNDWCIFNKDSFFNKFKKNNKSLISKIFKIL